MNAWLRKYAAETHFRRDLGLLLCWQAALAGLWMAGAL